MLATILTLAAIAIAAAVILHRLRTYHMRHAEALATLEGNIADYAAAAKTDTLAIGKKIDDGVAALNAAITNEDTEMTDAEVSALTASRDLLTGAKADLDTLAGTLATPPTAPVVTVPDASTPPDASAPVPDSAPPAATPVPDDGA